MLIMSGELTKDIGGIKRLPRKSRVEFIHLN